MIDRAAVEKVRGRAGRPRLRFWRQPGPWPHWQPPFSSRLFTPSPDQTTTAGIAAITAAGVGGVAVAGTGGDDDEMPITGPALERASAAALAHTGNGIVSETEVGDEDSFYEFEVTLDDGSQVDVQLDEDFNMVGASADLEDPGDTD